MTSRLLNAELRCSVRTLPTAEPQVLHFDLHGHHVLFDANSLAAVHVSPEAAAEFDRRPADAARFSGILFSRAAPQWPPFFGSPQKITLLVTNRCNLACRYCFIRDEIARGALTADDMSIDVARRALDLLRGDISVSFFGGEPLLAWQRVSEIVTDAERRAKGRKIQLHVTTNGTLLDDVISQFIRDHRMSVLVSLDGPPDVHNANRPIAFHPDPICQPPNSWTETLRGLSRLQGAKVIPYLRATYDDPDTDLAALLHFFKTQLVDEHLASGCSIEPAVLTEGCRTSDPARADLSCLAARYHQAAVWYADQARQGKPFDFMPFRKMLGRILYTRHMKSECGAGVGYLTVGPDGTIYACHKAGCALGNVIDGIDEVRRFPWSDNRVYRDSACMSCWARYLCGGGCRHHRLTLSGDVLGPAPACCAIQQTIIRESLWILAELGPDLLRRFIR